MYCQNFCCSSKSLADTTTGSTDKEAGRCDETWTLKLSAVRTSPVNRRKRKPTAAAILVMVPALVTKKNIFFQCFTSAHNAGRRQRFQVKYKDQTSVCQNEIKYVIEAPLIVCGDRPLLLSLQDREGGGLSS
jgi:hypothetical protein